MKNCETCKNEFEGYGKNCGTCRSKVSRNRNMLHENNQPVAPSVATDKFQVPAGKDYLRKWVEMGLDPDCKNAFRCFARRTCVCTKEEKEKFSTSEEPIDNFGEPNWKKYFKTKEEAKANLMSKVMGLGGKFYFWGEYETPDKLRELTK